MSADDHDNAPLLLLKELDESINLLSLSNGGCIWINTCEKDGGTYLTDDGSVSNLLRLP